jgi:hypothetical protein
MPVKDGGRRARSCHAPRSYSILNCEVVRTPSGGRTLSMEPAVELEIKPRTDGEPYLTPVRRQNGP